MEAQDRVLNILRQSGALLEGHFVLSSGLHSDRYIQCARVLQYPEYAAELGRALALRYAGQGIEAVVGPALGGVIVAHEVARALGVRAIFTEREKGEMTLRRGFTLERGESVLVVEDVITTGGSVREVLAVVEAHGARPAGVAALVDRSGNKAGFKLPVEVLVQLEVTSYEPAGCPLCRAGTMAVKPGSRT